MTLLPGIKSMARNVALHIEKQRLLHSVWFPLLFVLLLWFIKLFEVVTTTSFSHWGLYPKRLSGLVGILTAPLLHSDWTHLLNNSVSVFFLACAIFYFYRVVAWETFSWIWFMNGFWLWFFGRPSYHIGASGLIYGMGAFLFISGIIRRNQNLLAISLLVVFLYGSMIWGIFPIKSEVSWESHLTGMLAGIVMAIYYRNYGPSATRYFLIFRNSKFNSANDEGGIDFDEEDENDPYWITGDNDEKF